MPTPGKQHRLPVWPLQHAVIAACAFSLILSFPSFNRMRDFRGAFGGFDPFSFYSAACGTAMLAVIGVLGFSAFCLFARHAWSDAHAALREHEGRCENCGYSLEGAAGTQCPECGVMEAAAPRPRVRRLRVLVIVLSSIATSILASAAAEVWIGQDESDFMREASAWEAAGGVGGDYTRARRWPNGSSTMTYSPATGLASTP